MLVFFIWILFIDYFTVEKEQQSMFLFLFFFFFFLITKLAAVIMQAQHVCSGTGSWNSFNLTQTFG